MANETLPPEMIVARERVTFIHTAVSEQTLVVLRDAKAHTLGAKTVMEVDAAELAELQSLLVELVKREADWNLACAEYVQSVRRRAEHGAP